MLTDADSSTQREHPGMGQPDAVEGYLVLPDTAPLGPLVTGYHELTRAAAGAGLPGPEPLPPGAGQQEVLSPLSITASAVSPQKLTAQQSGALLSEPGG
jgi:hypothetical protein